MNLGLLLGLTAPPVPVGARAVRPLDRVPPAPVVTLPPPPPPPAPAPKKAEAPAPKKRRARKPAPVKKYRAAERRRGLLDTLSALAPGAEVNTTYILERDKTGIHRTQLLRMLHKLRDQGVVVVRQGGHHNTQRMWRLA